MIGLARTGQRIGDQGTQKHQSAVCLARWSILNVTGPPPETTPWRRVGGLRGAVMAPGEPAGVCG